MRSISHEQRHRRRTITFVEIVNGAGATSTFFSKREKLNRVGNFSASSSADVETMFQFANTTADVRQLLDRTSVSPQTCDKKKIEFLEVNFYDNKKSSDYIGFTDVFEFSSDLKKR